MSEYSSPRTNVIAEDNPEKNNGCCSVAPPGSIPVPCRVTPPSMQCGSIRLRSASVGQNQPSGVTTFLPDFSSAATSLGFGISGEYRTQSASIARISSMLFVAITPTGADPMISPTSLPALSAECTQQPTSSRSGCNKICPIAARPTPPVAHWITRNTMTSPRR
jgi:hypothetical protein